MIPVYEKGNRSGVKAYHVAIVEVLNVARVQRQRRSLPYTCTSVQSHILSHVHPIHWCVISLPFLIPTSRLETRTSYIFTSFEVGMGLDRAANDGCDVRQGSFLFVT